MNIKKETIEEIGFIIKCDEFVVVLMPSVSVLIVTRRSSVCHAVVIIADIAVVVVVVFILKSLRMNPIVSKLSKHTKIAK